MVPLQFQILDVESIYDSLTDTTVILLSVYFSGSKVAAQNFHILLSIDNSVKHIDLYFKVKTQLFWTATFDI